MTPVLRLEKLKQIYSDKQSAIIHVASTPEIPLRRKQLLYACLNNMCQLSARLYSEISAKPGNHDLLDEAAELDAALLELRKHVGSLIPTRSQRAA
jgi:hypothetical protein